MRTWSLLPLPWFSISLLSFLLGCSNAGTGDSTDTTDTTDGSDTTGDSEGVCLTECMSDIDCLISGMDFGLHCVDNLCGGAGISSCTSDDQCIEKASLWVVPCTAGGSECDSMDEVCLDISLCALRSDAFDCSIVSLQEIPKVDIDGNPVVVCGQPNAACNDESRCVSTCQSNQDCAFDDAPVCNTGTGMCGCTSDADCAASGQLDRSVCTAAGFCGCGDDQHCVDSSTGDICTAEGFCGCSTDMSCAGMPNLFDGGMIGCVQL